MTQPTRKFQPWEIATYCVLACLFIFSLYLSLTRIYQVDEAQNVFMAKITATKQFHQYYTNGSLFLLGPLSWIAGSSVTAESMFAGARLLFLGVYWLNLLLLSFASGIHHRSPQFPVVLLAAATLAPLLDYGLEVRHDNLLLTLLLLYWIVVRRFRGAGWWMFLILGMLSGFLEFVAFKAFLYWVPLSIGLLLFPPPGASGRWPQRLLGCSLGVLLAFVACRLMYGLTGTWETYLVGFRTAVGHSSNPGRFAPWETLNRLLEPLALLLALLVAFGVSLIQRWRKVGLPAFDWEGEGPEFLVLLLATAAFLVNPTPYPYNLLLLVPFIFILVFKTLGLEGVSTFRDRLPLPLIVSVVLFCHVLPFGKSALRHLNWNNDRQRLLMETVESLTDPHTDRVFDACGLISTRESIGYQWFLHSLVMEKFRDGRLPPLRETLKTQAPAAILRSYRTDWLSSEDSQFIADHYLSIADDLLVLGKVLPSGGGAIDCLHEGRYLILNQGGASDQHLGSLMSVDDTPVSPSGVVFLRKGVHRIVGSSVEKTTVVWLGPTLAQLPQLPNHDHRLLFVNWY